MVDLDTAEITRRIATLRDQIEDLTRAAGRPPGCVTLIAVSKKFGPDYIAAAHAAGLNHFGENRAQEARRKIPFCPAGLTWHFIGPLQTNKVRYVVPLFATIHSVDREGLVVALERECRRRTTTVGRFIEVKVSPEPSKHGVPPDGLPALAEQVIASPHLRLLGLMTIPPWTPSPEDARPYFARLRRLRDRLQDHLGGSHQLKLSMGMSHDFPVAITEGADWIRLGEAVFGPRPE